MFVTTPTLPSQTLVRTKGIQRLAVVSDAAPVAGLPAGNHTCFGREVVLAHLGPAGFVVKDPERNCLAGESLRVAEAAGHVVCLQHSAYTSGHWSAIPVIGLLTVA